MAEQVSSRVYKISVDGAQAIKQLEKISGSATAIDQRLAAFGSTVRNVFAAGALIAGAKALSTQFQEVANRFDEAGKAAQKIGVGVEALTALNFAASQSGVSFESLQNGLKKLSVGMTELSDSSSEVGRLLKELGVTTADTSDTAFAKIAEQLSKMPDGFQKTAAAVKIFGKAGSDLIPLLNEGKGGLEAFTNRAEELGLVLKGSTVAQLTLFNDSLAEIGQSITGIQNKIAEGLAPALAGIAQTIADATKVSNAWVEVGRILGEVFVSTSIAIETAITDIKIIGLALESVTSLDKLKAFSAERDKLVAKSDEFALTLRSNVTAAEGMSGATDKIAESVTNLGGAVKQSSLESWAEGLRKTAAELDLVPEKMVLLATAMNTLRERGEEGSNAFKVMADAYKKLNEESAKGNVGAQLELQMQKIKDEATLTAEKIEYLGVAIASAFEQGDVEGAEIFLKMMQDLQGETKKTEDQFTKLGEGITDAIASNANNAVNSFIDNIGNAQMSFTDFATSIIKDLAKVVVQLLIMKPLVQSIKGLFGGFGGGEIGFETSFNAQGNSFAGGTGLSQGIYSQPTLFKFAKGGTFGGNIGVLGEGSGPEAIVPLKRTASGDLGVQASPVNVNVYNNAGVEVQTQSSQSADGTKQIDIYIEKKVRDGISNGTFDRQFRGAYGLSRVGA